MKQAMPFFFFFWEPRVLSCTVRIRVTTAEGSKICVSECFGLVFLFSLEQKKPCFSLPKETNNCIQIVQITCNIQLTLDYYCHSQSPNTTREWARKWAKSTTDRNLWKILLRKRTCVCLIRERAGLGRTRLVPSCTTKYKTPSAGPGALPPTLMLTKNMVAIWWLTQSEV